MSKSNITLAVNTEVLELANRKFPRKLSQLFEKFLKDLVLTANVEAELLAEEEIQKKVNTFVEREQKLKIERQALELQLSEIRQKKEQEALLTLTDEQTDWIQDIGVQIALRNNSNKAYKQFQAKFMLSHYPFTEFEKVLKPYYDEWFIDDEGQYAKRTP